MVHALLPLLMLEAIPTDLVFTISLKRSTLNLQLSTSWPADYPIYAPLATVGLKKAACRDGPEGDIAPFHSIRVLAASGIGRFDRQ
jgi:hypothetical protein